MKTHIHTQKKIHLIKLDKGEFLLESLSQYVKTNNISAGYFNGIGALEEARISYFDTKKKEYIETIQREVELISCIGNIGINKDNNEPIVHTHISVSDSKGKMYGGHLNLNSIVSVTVEIFLIELEGKINRIKDNQSNLYLIN